MRSSSQRKYLRSQNNSHRNSITLTLQGTSPQASEPWNPNSDGADLLYRQKTFYNRRDRPSSTLTGWWIDRPTFTPEPLLH
ncbi:MAG: hypothetical protein HC851_00745 [Acaryochloris sp. RU_4_1]|nr:hypothetical protein [Acaryochloris sp. RU_4_1]NJR53161.1 hypothetical protein [Acaryochloris sp. CRU_2_0]